MTTSNNSCPICSSDKVWRATKWVNAQGKLHNRYECRVCLERWTLVDGKQISNYTADKVYDWRVRASQGCTDCVHYLNGFCSLGLPEANNPAFVTECEARMVQERECVVH